MSVGTVAVVIPNYNGEKVIATAIKSILAQTYTETKIIVVENGSSDKSLAILKSFGHKIILLENKDNLGFAGGVNTGIRYAINHNFDAIALFNNDAQADSVWLSKLVEAMELQKNTGIVTGQIRLGDGQSIDSTGEFYTIWGLSFPRGRGKSIDTSDVGEYVFGASGGASLYRVSMFNEIGIFDESYFAYYEDVDISFRAQLAGWKVFYTPAAVVNHNQGYTSKNKMGKDFAIYQTFKNLPMVYIKNVPKELLFTVGSRFYIAYTLILTKAIFSGQGSAAIRGLFKQLRLLSHTLSQRKKIQTEKKVGSSYIKSILIHDLPPDQAGLRKFRSLFIGRK